MKIRIRILIVAAVLSGVAGLGWLERPRPSPYGALPERSEFPASILPRVVPEAAPVVEIIEKYDI